MKAQSIILGILAARRPQACGFLELRSSHEQNSAMVHGGSSPEIRYWPLTFFYAVEIHAHICVLPENQLEGQMGLFPLYAATNGFSYAGFRFFACFNCFNSLCHIMPSGFIGILGIVVNGANVPHLADAVQ